MSANPRAGGLSALRHALLEVLTGPGPAGVPVPATGSPEAPWWLADDLPGIVFSKAAGSGTTTLRPHAGKPGNRPGNEPGSERRGGPRGGPRNEHGDADLATSSEEDVHEGQRLIALVELARSGDKEAFGQLYDHYHVSVYRFLYYRVGGAQLAEDLTSETFFRALRSMSSFRWQGKDFGAWLMTIARNLATDHFKAGRTRLEFATEDERTLDGAAEGPEGEVLASLTNETLLTALRELPTEQRECLIMRFLQGLSIAETADVLGRSSGAVKQLQLRGVRNLAKLLPEGARP